MRQLFPAGFKTEVHNGKFLEVMDAEGKLLNLVDLKWLSDKLLSGEVMTMEDRTVAGAGLRHLLEVMSPFVPTHQCYYYVCDGHGRTLAPAFATLEEARLARGNYPEAKNVIPDGRGDYGVGVRFLEY